MDAGTVRIQRLRLRANETERRAALTELEQASWPDGGGAWILVRRVHVRAPRPWLGLRAAAGARRAVASAVPPGAAGAVEAPAIRFASRSELLAHLGADLAAGVAPRQWYWQHWQDLLELPPVEAATHLWGDEVAYLAAVTAILARDRRLADIWPRLGEAGARRLLQRLAEHTGMAALAGANRTGAGKTGAAYAGMIPDVQRQRWHGALRDIPAHHPAARLAAALVTLETRPTALFTRPEAVLPAVVKQLRRPGPAPLPGTVEEGETPATTDDVTEPKRHRGQRDEHRPARPPVPTTSSPGDEPYKDRGTRQSSGNNADGPRPPTVEADHTSTDVLRRPAPTKSPRSAPQRTHMEAGETPDNGAALAPPMDGEFATAQAGTLYLINALRHPAAAGIIEAHGGWDALPGGWAWLFRLGETLGLDADDPIVAFLARQLNMDRVAELEALPPLPASDRLTAALQGAYGDVWAPALLDVPGRVRYTPSHVDALLPMSQVRLEVRTAGLDVNPGWVPWLGRVVIFHYNDTGVPP